MKVTVEVKTNKNSPGTSREVDGSGNHYHPQGSSGALAKSTTLHNNNKSKSAADYCSNSSSAQSAGKRITSGAEPIPYKGRQKPRVNRRIVLQKPNADGSPIFPSVQEDPQQLAKLAISEDAPNVSMYKLRKELCAPLTQDSSLINIRTMMGSVRQKKRHIIQPSGGVEGSGGLTETFPFVGMQQVGSGGSVGIDERPSGAETQQIQSTGGGISVGGYSVGEHSASSSHPISVMVGKLPAPGLMPGNIRSGEGAGSGVGSPGRLSTNYNSLNSALVRAGAKSLDSLLGYSMSPTSVSRGGGPAPATDGGGDRSFSPEVHNKIKLLKYKTGLSPLTKVKRLQKELEQRSDLLEYMQHAPMNDDEDDHRNPNGGAGSDHKRGQTQRSSPVGGHGSRGSIPGAPASPSIDTSDLDSMDSRRPLSSMRKQSQSSCRRRGESDSLDIEVSNSPKPRVKSSVLEDDGSNEKKQDGSSSIGGGGAGGNATVGSNNNSNNNNNSNSINNGQSVNHSSSNNKSFDIKAEMNKLNDPRFKKLYGSIGQSSDADKTIEISKQGGSLSKQIHQLYLMTPTPLSAHQPIEEEDPLYSPEKFRIPIIQARRPGDKETVFNSVALRDEKFRSKSRTGSRSGSRASSRAVSRAVSRAGSSTDLFSRGKHQQQSRSLHEYNAKIAREREESEQSWTGTGGLSAAEYLAMNRDEIRTRACTAERVPTQTQPCRPVMPHQHQHQHQHHEKQSQMAGSFADMFDQQQFQEYQGLVVDGEGLEGSTSTISTTGGGGGGSVMSHMHDSQQQSLSILTGNSSSKKRLHGGSGGSVLTGHHHHHHHNGSNNNTSNHKPQRRAPVKLTTGGTYDSLTCRHCLREALLWCDECKTPYCYGCWGKVPHHDYADSSALQIKTNRPVHLQYKDFHFEPMCMDSHGNIVTTAEEESARAQAARALEDECSDFNMTGGGMSAAGSWSRLGTGTGTGTGIGIGTGVNPGGMINNFNNTAAITAAEGGVVGDEDYGFASSSRTSNRDKVRNAPKRAAGLHMMNRNKGVMSTPNPNTDIQGAKLTRSMVAMLSEEYQAGGAGGAGSLVYGGGGGSLASSLTGVESITGSVYSKETHQLANQYLPASSVQLKEPGTYGCTIPRTSASRNGGGGGDSCSSSRAVSRTVSRSASRAVSRGGSYTDSSSVGEISRAGSQSLLFEDESAMGLTELNNNQSNAPGHYHPHHYQETHMPPEFEVNNHPSPQQAHSAGYGTGNGGYCGGLGSSTEDGDETGGSRGGAGGSSGMNASGSLISDTGIYIPSGARTLTAASHAGAAAHQHHQSLHGRQPRLRHPNEHYEIHISPIRPHHTIQQDAGVRGASVSGARKHREPPQLPMSASGELELSPELLAEAMALAHSHGHPNPNPQSHDPHNVHPPHLEDYRCALHPKEFKADLPFAQQMHQMQQQQQVAADEEKKEKARGPSRGGSNKGDQFNSSCLFQDQSTYVEGPASPHMVEAEARLQARREKQQHTVTINGRTVHVNKPIHNHQQQRHGKQQLHQDHFPAAPPTATAATAAAETAETATAVVIEEEGNELSSEFRTVTFTGSGTDAGADAGHSSFVERLTDSPVSRPMTGETEIGAETETWMGVAEGDDDEGEIRIL